MPPVLTLGGGYALRFGGLGDTVLNGGMMQRGAINKLLEDFSVAKRKSSHSPCSLD